MTIGPNVRFDRNIYYSDIHDNEGIHFDIQSTGQAHIVNIFSDHRNRSCFILFNECHNIACFISMMLPVTKCTFHTHLYPHLWTIVSQSAS